MMDERLFERRVRELAMEATTVPAPADTWQQIAARVRNGDVVALPTTVARTQWTRTSVMRAAAVVLLLGAAAAAAALPVLPVRAWVVELFTHDTPLPQPLPAAPVTITPTAETILLVEPSGDQLLVMLETPGSDVRVHVRFADARELEVRARAGAAGAQFRSGAGRITVVNAAAGDVLLTIPRAVGRVRIEVDGRALLTKENGRVQVLASVADTAGAEIILPVTR